MGAKKKGNKPLPDLKSDSEAEQFITEADLTEYELSGFKPVQFEFQRKNAQVNMRMPQALLDAIKKRARQRGIPYQRYIREILERSLWE